MKVLLGTPSLLPEIGGPAYSVGMIRRHLDLSGVDTLMVTEREKGGAGLTLFSNKQLFDGVDLVHNFGTWTPFNHRVAMASRNAKKPYVFCPMGMLEPWSLGQKRLKKLLALMLYQRKDIEASAAIHATATLEAENLRAMGVRAPIAVIPHGIDLPTLSSPRSFRGSDSAQRTILFLSRIHPKKGLLELVSACSRLSCRDWRVVIAGPDQDGYQSVVEVAVKEAGLEAHFQFVGPVYDEEKKSLFEQADLFVLPTHSENFGVVIAEALAHQVPVITTTGAPWHELVKFRCGWWISPEVDALENALSEAVALPVQELRAMGVRGRELVEARYGWDKIIHLHIELYDWILGRCERPAFMFD